MFKKDLRVARQRTKLSQLKKKALDIAYSSLPTDKYIEAASRNRGRIQRLQAAFRRERISEYRALTQEEIAERRTRR